MCTYTLYLHTLSHTQVLVFTVNYVRARERYIHTIHAYTLYLHAHSHTQVLVFTVDYVLRLYAAGCHKEYAGLGYV